MSLTVSKLRENIYKIVDEVLETGRPVEIVRNGKKVLLCPAKPESKLSKAIKRNIINGDPEDIVHMDWSKEWKPTL